MSDDRLLAEQLGYTRDHINRLSAAQITELVRAERDRRRPVTIPVGRPRVGMDGQSYVNGFHVTGGSTPTGTSLTAAAAVLQPYGQSQAKLHERQRQRSTVARDTSGWQSEAWALLDEVGELWFAGSWVSAALSRIRIVAAKVTDNNEEPRILGGIAPLAEYDSAGHRKPVSDADEPKPKPVDSDDDRKVAELIAHWAGGPSGQEQVLARVGWHLGIAGDTYLVAREESAPVVPGADPDAPRTTTPGTDTDPAPLELPESGGGSGVDDLIWAAYSNEELTSKNGAWSVSDGGTPYDLPDGKSLVIRCWRPHPRKFRQAASAVRAALPILRELRGLTQHVSAQIESRLAGAGLLLLPQSMTFVSTSQDGQPDGPDPFITMLMEAMVTPIKDRDSAAAVVPLVVRVPDESIGKAQYIRFGDTQLDKTARDLRDEAIERLALSLDLPREVVTGLGATNHWSAWQIDESAIKMHVAPIAATFCHALTVGWLHPALKAMGIADATDYLVWFDTTPLVLRPDRSEQAQELYDRAVIGAEALRRETGFAETDAPSESERKEQLLIRIVERAPTMAPVVLPMLGIDVPKSVLDAAEANILAISGLSAQTRDNGPGQDPIRDARQITKDERKEISRRSTSQPSRSQTDKTASPSSRTASAAFVCDVDDALLEACHMAVLHALQYAGKRMSFGSRRNQAELRTTQAENPYRMHMVVSCEGRDLDHLLAGAWNTVQAGRDDADRLVPILDSYVRLLLEHRVEHSRDYLRAALQQAGVCLEDQ